MRKLLTLIGLTFFIITGCSNGDFEKAMDEGNSALTNKEYTKALASFERALGEKKDDKETKALIEQTTAMIEAMKLKEETKMDEAITSFEKVENIENGSNTLVEQAKEERTALLALMEKKEKESQQNVESDKKSSEANTKKETVDAGKKPKTNEEAKKPVAENAKKETVKKQDEFTVEKAIEYIKKQYDEEYEYTPGKMQVENGKKYYEIGVRTTYKIEGAGGPGFTGRFKVFEDGTIIELHR
jgi:hypothetical protein